MAAMTRCARQLIRLLFVRTNEDSVPFPYAHGKNENLPRTLARELKIDPPRCIYSGTGGQTPQAFVNEMARRIHDGEIEAAMVVGSEAIKASKAAKKHGIELDWTDDAPGETEYRQDAERMLNRTEIKHGMISPPYFYGMFENAIAHREGRTRSEHRAAMSRLFAKFAAVAAENPYAQFPEAKSAIFLATPSPENYEFVDPFLKWHVAQDAVNVGAAVIIVSEDKADELGVPKDQRVYLHGGGEAADTMISERIRMDGSWAMQTALGRALDAAGKTAADMDVFDLYSCFPCAVFSSTAELGIDPETEARALTVTGGLPFAGGPGNNYSLHGIAAMHHKLRARFEAFGLVLANGGWMTKEAAGVYSTQRPAEFVPAAPMAKQKDIVELAETPGSGTLETYTVVHGRSGPKQGIAFGRTEDDRRFIALATKDALDQLREDKNQIGAKMAVTTEGEVNTFRFA